MSPVWLKHVYFVLCALTWRPVPADACSRLCSRVEQLFFVGSGKFLLYPNWIRINVMYHSQVMFAPVLTVKRNDYVTLSKYVVNRGKGNKKKKKNQEMTMHFLFLEYFGIDLKVQENAITLAMDIKAFRVPEEVGYFSVLTYSESRVIPGSRVGSEFLLGEFQKLRNYHFHQCKFC